MKMPFIPKVAKNQQGFTETVKRRGGYFSSSSFQGERVNLKKWKNGSGSPQISFPLLIPVDRGPFLPFPISHNQSLGRVARPGKERYSMNAPGTESKLKRYPFPHALTTLISKETETWSWSRQVPSHL